MLDSLVIFTKGGIVLWSKNFDTLQGSPVDHLIQTVLLEERKGAEKAFTTGNYKVEWTFHNDLELVFVSVYQKILQLLYIEEMLELIKNKFVALFGGALKAKSLNMAEPVPFEKQFERIRIGCETKAQESKQARNPQRRFEETKKGKGLAKGGEKNNKNKKKKPGDTDLKENEIDIQEDSGEEEQTGVGDGSNGTEEPQQQQQQDQQAPVESQTGVEVAEVTAGSASNGAALSDADASILAKREALKKKMAGRGRAPGPMRKGPKAGGKAAAPAEASDPKKRTKQARRWDDGPDTGKLDHSDGGQHAGQEHDSSGKYGSAKEQINPDDWNEFFKDKTGSHDDSDEDEEEETPQAKTSGWSIGSIFTGLTNRVLKKEDLMAVLSKFRETLIAKNVASEIADHLCQSVCTSLEGKTLSSFSRVRSAVRTTLEEALTRILTPKNRVEVLQEISRVRKKENRPFSIVFVGVNGVGKSTNLAKVCAYLLQNNLKVMITACDTFRSGAVEQLRVHSRNLEVPLFERGYEKDPALVAQNGLYEGKQQGMDVVLIDTAGRMQDKRPLMQALAKLVYTNNPDLILFVGEALVGNEAVDQLKRFNLALEEFVPSNIATARQIDGIILTKFDTIDDKVGAAISMVYTTGQPIVFVGTGQKYGDLKRMNVSTVIRALLG